MWFQQMMKIPSEAVVIIEEEDAHFE